MLAISSTFDYNYDWHFLKYIEVPAFLWEGGNFMYILILFAENGIFVFKALTKFINMMANPHKGQNIL